MESKANNNCDISIIILNYNSGDFTENCVKSLIDNNSNDNYEIIIVDNCSNKEEFEKLNSLRSIPNLKIFRSRINLGFSGGNMFGFQNANKSSKYYFFLNNDCILLNDVVNILFNFMESNQDAGMCTPQMYSPEKEFRPSFTYFPDVSVRLFGHSAVRFFSPEKYPPRRKVYESPISIPVITGSAMFIRAKHFAEIGGFDTNYFLYSEEEDLCKRFSLKGYNRYLVPSSKFVHYNGGSTNSSYAVLKEFHISLFYFYKKFYKLPKRLILTFYYFIKNLRKFYKSYDFFKLAFFILRGAPMKDSMKLQQKINDVE
jgi:GT2 family glycosyltransferase